MKRVIGIVALVAATVGLVGCASAPLTRDVQQRVLDVDASFDQQSLSQGGLLIAGMGTTSAANAEKLQSVENLLADNFGRLLGQDRITLVDELAPTLAAEVKQGVLKGFYQPQAKGKQSRYVLYYHLVDDKVANSSHTGDLEECFYTSRQVGFNVDIYDTWSSKLVYVSEQQSELQLKNCNERGGVEEGGSWASIFVDALVGGVVDRLFDESFGTYPEAPALEVVMAPSMAKVIGSIPSTH